MKSSRYILEQVAFGLRQAEDGAPVSEVCRKIGMMPWVTVAWTAWMLAPFPYAYRHGSSRGLGKPCSCSL